MSCALHACVRFCALDIVVDLKLLPGYGAREAIRPLLKRQRFSRLAAPSGAFWQLIRFIAAARFGHFAGFGTPFAKGISIGSFTLTLEHADPGRVGCDQRHDTHSSE